MLAGNEEAGLIFLIACEAIAAIAIVVALGFLIYNRIWGKSEPIYGSDGWF